ncbi:SDR family NAD(P)-dependent oxidoreductase [Pelagicoccus sp. SDUM812003]|uniref:SDR family NAD(P)-dependent oxidoreductase n=1 Tax=Pelagicoccus sp. SDUM812003 TaxID=3041267 RepID=UPI00280D88E5|nr:SDR family NAD(P)-dependent oxidoreductase [Pelagicoccus sp. SDUM812003]MDQ8205362.1 SDR family oxidoreductase [Pelagicoccus sp. SDUM812003]
MSDYLNELFNLDGKVAVVVGGTGELCGAMAEGLAGAGVTTVLVGRSQEKAQARIAKIEQAGGKATFETANLADKQSIRDLLARVCEAHGGVDILINGAGANSPTPFLDIPEDEYDRLFDINTKAVFLSCQVFGKYFLEKGQGGSIINVGSMSGVTPLSRVFTYSATKAAVHNLSKNLAREWAPQKIRVNTIVPGFFPAEQNRKVLTEERVGQIMGHTPMKRFGEAKELIGATLLLASDSAGSFITGAEILVDGGYAAMTI